MLQRPLDMLRPPPRRRPRRQRGSAVTLDVRDLTKSALTLPWAISMFGVQQMANLVGAPPSQQGLSGAAHAFDSVSDVAERQLDGWMKQTCKVGNGVQGAVVDLIMLRAPNVDSSTLMRMAAEMQSGPLFHDREMRHAAGRLARLVPRAAPRQRQPGGIRQQAVHHLARDAGARHARARQGLARLAAGGRRSRGSDGDVPAPVWATEGTGNYWERSRVGSHRRHRSVRPPERRVRGVASAVEPHDAPRGHRDVVCEESAGGSRDDEHARGRQDGRRAVHHALPQLVASRLHGRRARVARPRDAHAVPESRARARSRDPIRRPEAPGVLLARRRPRDVLRPDEHAAVGQRAVARDPAPRDRSAASSSRTPTRSRASRGRSPSSTCGTRS